MFSFPDMAKSQKFKCFNSSPFWSINCFVIRWLLPEKSRVLLGPVKEQKWDYRLDIGQWLKNRFG